MLIKQILLALLEYVNNKALVFSSSESGIIQVTMQEKTLIIQNVNMTGNLSK